MSDYLFLSDSANEFENKIIEQANKENDVKYLPNIPRISKYMTVMLKYLWYLTKRIKQLEQKKG